MAAIWKGTVSFGLVSIPVSVATAIESKDINFRQVHKPDGGRVQNKRLCTVDGQEVPYNEIAKGYEVSKDEIVVLTDEDLAHLPLPTTHTIEVESFVPLVALDPIHFDRTYYLEPQPAGVKPYVLLRDALKKSGHVAVAKVALRQRETVAVVRVYDGVLALTTLLWPDEIRAPDFRFLRDEAPPLDADEIEAATALVNSMSADQLDLGRYRDTYREALQALIDAKIHGGEVTAPTPAATPREELPDLLTALRRSIAESRVPEPRKRPQGRTSGKNAPRKTR